MGSRWQDWVITIALCLLTVIGVATLWGDALSRLWQDETAPKVEKKPEGTAVPVAPGPAAGPF